MFFAACKKHTECFLQLAKSILNAFVVCYAHSECFLQAAKTIQNGIGDVEKHSTHSNLFKRLLGVHCRSAQRLVAESPESPTQTPVLQLKSILPPRLTNLSDKSLSSVVFGVGFLHLLNQQKPIRLDNPLISIPVH